MIGSEKTRKQNSTRDSGKTWKVEVDKIMFKSNFKLSTIHVYHKKTLMTIIDLLSNFGGLVPNIILFFLIPASFINQQIVIAKYIRSIYFIRDVNDKVKNIEFSLSDKLSDFKRAFDLRRFYKQEDSSQNS